MVHKVQDEKKRTACKLIITKKLRETKYHEQI